jgi:hypothetical protein
MTLTSRIARLEDRVPTPAPAIVITRTFYVTCPHCGVAAPVDREADPARHTPTLGADTPGATGVCRDGCGRPFARPERVPQVIAAAGLSDTALAAELARRGAEA